MTNAEIIELVQRYFAAVDGEDFDAIWGTMTDDCVFSVETHGVRLQGREAIAAMFDRLWSDHDAVRHQDFVYVPDAENGRIAVRFQVINTLPGGEKVYKSNCNFFEVSGGGFSAVAVYMAGENTLT